MKKTYEVQLHFEPRAQSPETGSRCQALFLYFPIRMELICLVEALGWDPASKQTLSEEG